MLMMLGQIIKAHNADSASHYLKWYQYVIVENSNNTTTFLFKIQSKLL